MVAVHHFITGGYMEGMWFAFAIILLACWLFVEAA